MPAAGGSKRKRAQQSGVNVDIRAHAAVPERHLWTGKMQAPTADLQEHFPKKCSKTNCRLGGDISLVPLPPILSTGV